MTGGCKTAGGQRRADEVVGALTVISKGGTPFKRRPALPSVSPLESLLVVPCLTLTCSRPESSRFFLCVEGGVPKPAQIGTCGMTVW
mmetsp:Transcript_52881/g.86923  ORF Transcript_52881/g.86923 Transcript_52881/m.86923 type:complete len:87 (+) Transcript_52881:69-329(+)